jgi:O-antigen/teichoic acid export membrane protein
MQENTNRTIAYNSIILYGKMAITTICALLTTRFALHALGVVDFGLYTVLGGIISFISIFNTIMLSTSNRFIAVAIGKGDINEANKQFNVNLVVHIAIAVFAIIVAFPIGEWYIPRYVNYDGPISNAIMVFFISIIGSVLSFVGVPYNGLLMAKEKFIVFSLVDVISHILKLTIAWVLIYYFDNKLLIYTITMAFLTAMHTIVYLLYCSKFYPEIVKLRLVKDK